MIVTGRQAFLDVGNALIAIRDGKLYRDQFGTFERYCQVKWEFDRSHAYRLIRAADVLQSLSPIGHALPLPKNEAQTRPLVALPDEKRPEAWKIANELAGDSDVTAKHVASAVKSLLPPVPPSAASKRAKSAIRVPDVGTFKPVTEALKLVDRIEECVVAGNVHELLRLVCELRQALCPPEA